MKVTQPLLSRISGFLDGDIGRLIADGGAYKGTAKRRLAALEKDVGRLIDESYVQHEKLSGELNNLGSSLEQRGLFGDAMQARENPLIVLNADQPDAVLDALKAKSVLWQNEMISDPAYRIESLIRSGAEVNAEAATFFGHPIGSAHIPLNASGENRQASSYAEMLIPDGIVGDAKGFSSIDDAIRMADEFRSANPGVTLIGIEDSRRSVHVLAANVNTEARTVKSGRRFQRDSVLTKDVAVESGHSSVRWIMTSDGHLTRFNEFRPPADATQSVMHSTPMTLDELMRAPGGLTRRAPLDKDVEKYLSMTDEVGDLETGVHQLEQLKDRIAIERSASSSSLTVKKPPGRSPGDDEPVFTNYAGRQIVLDPFTTSRPFHLDDRIHSSLDDAVNSAARQIDAGRNNKMVAVVADHNGDFRLRTMERHDLEFVKDLRQDLQAIVDPRTGYHWIVRRSEGAGGSARATFELQKLNIPGELCPQNEFGKLQQSLKEMFKRGQIDIRPFIDDAYMHILPDMDLQRAKSRILNTPQKGLGHKTLLLVQLNKTPWVGGRSTGHYEAGAYGIVGSNSSVGTVARALKKFKAKEIEAHYFPDRFPDVSVGRYPRIIGVKDKFNSWFL